LSYRWLILNVFNGLLIAYIVLLVTECLKPGFVTFYVNLNYLLHALIVCGMASLWVYSQVGIVRKAASAVFFASLILFAIDNVFNWNVLQPYKTYLMVITLLSGTIILWSNKDKLDLQNEAESEREEDERIVEEAKGRWKVPVVGWLARWMQKEGRFYSLTLLVILVSGALYLLNIAANYWVGTDEGRLLYDSSLVLQGKVPMVDFVCRSPLLVYIIALSQIVFFASILAGRIVSVISVLISGFLIYMIGKQIHTQKTGLVASFIFVFYPWVGSFLSVQTQSFQIMWVLLFFYFLISGLKYDKPALLACSGLFLGLSSLVRESSLIFMLTLPFMLYVCCKDIKLIAREFLYVLIPFVIIVAVPTVIYKSLGAGVVGLTGDIVPMSASVMGRHLVGGLPRIMFFIPFIIPFLLCLVIDSIKGYWSDFFKSKVEMKFGYAILLYWLGSLLLFYTGYAVVSKFHFQYFREFFPIFALMTAMVTVFYSRVILKARSRIGAVLLPLVIFGAVYIPFFASAQAVMNDETPRYTQAAVEEVSSYIKENTDRDDLIFCGSPIWAYMSERNNAGFLSHITSYDDPQMLADIEASFIEGKVKYVVLDGYTEKVLKESKYLTERLDADYKLAKEVRKGSYWSIKILEMKTSSAE